MSPSLDRRFEHPANPRLAGNTLAAHGRAVAHIQYERQGDIPRVENKENKAISAEPRHSGLLQADEGGSDDLVWVW